jgi:hypothetical protein
MPTMGAATRRLAGAPLLAALLVATGCADFGDPTAASPVTTRPQTILQLGDDVRTASGNVVAVLKYELPASGQRDRGIAAALVEACAGANASGNTGASPAFFRIELADRRGLTPTVPARQPALRGVRLEPGDCTEGWVSFRIGPGQTPRYVTFRGSSVAKWELPR